MGPKIEPCGTPTQQSRNNVVLSPSTHVHSLLHPCDYIKGEMKIEKSNMIYCVKKSFEVQEYNFNSSPGACPNSQLLRKKIFLKPTFLSASKIKCSTTFIVCLCVCVWVYVFPLFSTKSTPTVKEVRLLSQNQGLHPITKSFHPIRNCWCAATNISKPTHWETCSILSEPEHC